MANKIPLNEALKTTLANGQAEEFRGILKTRQEELANLNPTEQTYFEAWDNILRVRQDRKDPNEPLIWDAEKSNALKFLKLLQTKPLPLEEAAEIRQATLGTKQIQSTKDAILAAWDLRGSEVEVSVLQSPQETPKALPTHAEKLSRKTTAKNPTIAPDPKKKIKKRKSKPS